MYFSTIAAISTPRGKGGVSLIRISGSEALSVAQKAFRAKNGKKIQENAVRTQIYGDFISPASQEVLDDGLLTYFASPASFTGEDVVEIACHGGEIVTGMVLNAVLSAGAVMAAPGEFSRRAFMNGKLSLTEAEGIADLLDAKTEAAASLSSKASRGLLSAAIREVSDSVLAAASSLWAYLDYPEEDLQSMSDEELCQLLDANIDACNRLIKSFDTGRAVNSGINCVIVGKPNVGKSTFFNLLLGEEKAIVTDIPGTTRDIIEYPVKAGQVLLNLADTAGVRFDTEDPIEKIGVEKALKILSEAELVFAMFDQSRPFEEEDQLILQQLSSLKEGARILPVFTKCDLPSTLDRQAIPAYGKSFSFSLDDATDLTSLFDEVERLFISDESALRDGRILTNARQKAQIVKAAELLERGKLQILTGSKDLASLTLEDALAALLETDGKAVGEMILNEVFSRFCIGK